MGAIPYFDLTGKTALVTGSSGGLGLAMARGLAEAGAEIVLNGRDPDRLTQAAESFGERAGQVHFSVFDVCDEEAIKGAFGRLDDEGRAIDILVNNAGVQFRRPMLELESADWRRVLETNLTSAFIIGREAARRMIARGGGGKIINIGSLTSEVARATVAPYTAAKGGIKMLTRSMAAEWAAHGIQANAIGPGYIDTEMNKALTSDAKFDAWVKGRTPSGRWGLPKDLVGTAIFLASAASDYVNGQIIYVDGGMLAVL
ncbi:SDR family oxidoreductase [Mesorhizobium sp. NZP2298]|uniref:SDR family oxidoreductase n=1 Tax=Mesorhizobium sp. NZP2298 TaxID=2483403 RepID=UPI00155302D9|nr:SDR family oxidoreductase [Mesorhizobium sp. NZP2298]QKC95546.1 SDR family oxidoreductase [Mesorhizobium sp. NZP2298]